MSEFQGDLLHDVQERQRAPQIPVIESGRKGQAQGNIGRVRSKVNESRQMEQTLPYLDRTERRTEDKFGERCGRVPVESGELLAKYGGQRSVISEGGNTAGRPQP